MEKKVYQIMTLGGKSICKIIATNYGDAVSKFEKSSIFTEFRNGFSVLVANDVIIL